MKHKKKMQDPPQIRKHKCVETLITFYEQMGKGFRWGPYFSLALQTAEEEPVSYKPPTRFAPKHDIRLRGRSTASHKF